MLYADLLITDNDAIKAIRSGFQEGDSVADMMRNIFPSRRGLAARPK